jgi:excisionase family DNA binding protein
MQEPNFTELEPEFKNSPLNLTLPEAAEALGVSLATARRLVRSGKLKAIKVQHEDRSRWEVTQDAITEFNLNPGSERASNERASRVQKERTSTEPEFTPELDSNTPVGLIQAHLAALALVERLQQKIEDDQRRFETLARNQGAMQQELAQYQRALTETAESLAEERAHRLTLEAQKMQEETAIELPQVQPRQDIETPKKGWGARIKRWIWGRTG